jgi:hypothetical protein
MNGERQRVHDESCGGKGQRDEDTDEVSQPRRGPLVLRGARASAAAAKADAREFLAVGEFIKAVDMLVFAERNASPNDHELPILLAQAMAGATATRGVAAAERSAWCRVYGTAEPTRASDVVAFVDPIIGI